MKSFVKSLPLLPLVVAGCLAVGGAFVADAQLPDKVEVAPVATAIVLEAVNSDDPMAALRALKKNNELILAKQAEQLATLEKLDQAAEQIRIFARRS